MDGITRRFVLAAGAAGLAGAAAPRGALALSETLTELGASLLAQPPATVLLAREIATLDPARPSAEAVAVVNGRILWVGSRDEVIGILGKQPYNIDSSFADQVLVPGFIAQHDHPVLAALTMSSEILSIEDWVLPSGVVPAVKDKQDFLQRLGSAAKIRARSSDIA